MTTTDTPYDLLYSGFQWDLPARFNIAEACADAWARDAPDRICLIEDRSAEPAATMSYGELARRSARLAAAFWM